MQPDRLSRRRFVSRSALAAGSLGLIGPAAAGAARPSEEDGMRYDEFLRQSIAELPTPALLIDLDIFERNLATMAEACRRRGTRLRPHGKAHKSPVIGKQQLDGGAIGLCAAKLGEAEVLVGGGILDVLITAPVVGRRKIARLMRLLAATPQIKVVADDEQNIKELSEAAQASGRRLKVLVDVNVGQNRTGVDRADEAAALATLIAREKGLEFEGVQAYGGSNMHVVGFENRKAASLQALERAIAARQAIEKAGLPVRILSVGGTGTYNIDAGYPGVTEIQPGSYIFMDAHYRSIGSETSEMFSDFGTSLSVLATIISRPAKGRAITDAGNKALSTDEGLPALKDSKGISYRPGGDEYGILSLTDPARDFTVGDKVEFIAGHCDTTVNLHDVFFGVRKEIVEAVWPIEGRGRTD